MSPSGSGRKCFHKSGIHCSMTRKSSQRMCIQWILHMCHPAKFCLLCLDKIRKPFGSHFRNNRKYCDRVSVLYNCKPRATHEPQRPSLLQHPPNGEPTQLTPLPQVPSELTLSSLAGLSWATTSADTASAQAKARLSKDII
jgi:hypothetical protein